MYIDENGKSTTAMPIVTDEVVQYQDTSQSYISIHDAVELVCKARRMKPLDGIIVDTMSWAISFVNSVPSVKFSSTDSSGDYVRRDDVLMCLTGEYAVDEKCDPVDLSTRFMKRIKSLPSVKFSSTESSCTSTDSSTDCISRQAVIDTIETDCSWDMFDEFGNRTPTGECIIEAIKRVPSVEPEECGDCISRQQALDAFCLSEKTRRVGGDRSGYDTMMLYEIQDILEDLPSVKPIAKNATTTEDCISREAAIGAVGYYSLHSDDKLLFADKPLKDLPSVEPERKTGKWIEHDTGHSIYYDCSLCGCLAPCTETADEILWKMANYCPDCGAEMEGGVNCNAED